MWLKSHFKSLTSTSTRRRSISRSQPASRLCLEALEDRCLMSFSPVVTYPAGESPRAVVTGDFNNDTRLDLAVANFGSSTVSVLLGNADGTFQAPQNSATGFLPRSLAVGDFNEDGKLDLATANEGDVSVLLGNGNGTFGTPTNKIVYGSPGSVAVGDFNADGNLDLGVASSIYFPPEPGDPYYGGGSEAFYQSYANVLLGNGTGTMSVTGPYPTESNYAYASNYQQPTVTAAVADINGDGRGDFVSTSSNTYYASVLLGNLNGSLSYWQSLGIAFNSQALVVQDVSGDGKADLVVGSGDGVAVRLGGLGSFGAVQNYAIGEQSLSLAVADFNGDGTLDVVAGAVGNISVILGTGAGAFKPPVNLDGAFYPAGIVASDFNRDSRPDVAMADFSNVAVLFNDGAWLPLNAPSLTINDWTVTEGNTGTTTATFTVTLSAAYSQPVSVHYATAGGGATVAGGDYQATSGDLTFVPGGPLTQTLTVLVNGDRVHEVDETFYVRLSDATNAFVADATGVGTIVDDEPYISLVGQVTNLEGNTGTTAFLFTVTLSAAYDVPVTVDFATADLTPDEQYWYGPGATAGVDYTATAGTVTFNPGQPLTHDIVVLVTGDRVGDWDELFFVNLSNPSFAQLTSTQALGYIVDDEPFVSIGGSGAVVEGNSGTKTMTFTVTLSASSDAPVTVTYATQDYTATVAGGDYQAKTGTLTFNPGGPLTQNITVLVNGDRLGEYTEEFYVNLMGANGARINTGSAYGGILDDEPRLTINSVSITEGNSGTKVMTFTVTLSAAYDQAVTVNYATHDSSATVAGNDYVATSGTLTFAPGQKTKTFTVTIKGDKQKESDESFYVLLSGASNNALIDNAYGWGSILNDDGPIRGNNRK